MNTMKTIKFRPLRRIKKTGTITVASYLRWNKIRSADSSDFNLIIDNQYKGLPLNEFVYNHKGEQLFWYNHKNPDALPLNYADQEMIDFIEKHFGIDTDFFAGEKWKFTEPLTRGFHHSVKGFDCEGTPVFSHYTADYIATHHKDVNDFEPLTVGMVVKWFGWFLYQLRNSYLIK